MEMGYINFKNDGNTYKINYKISYLKNMCVIRFDSPRLDIIDYNKDQFVGGVADIYIRQCNEIDNKLLNLKVHDAIDLWYSASKNNYFKTFGTACE